MSFTKCYVSTSTPQVFLTSPQLKSWAGKMGVSLISPLPQSLPINNPPMFNHKRERANGGCGKQAGRGGKLAGRGVKVNWGEGGGG